MRVRLLRNVFNFKPVVKNVMRRLKHDPVGDRFSLHGKKQIFLIYGLAEVRLTGASGTSNPNRLG
jgi:hypothetical protein